MRKVKIEILHTLAWALVIAAPLSWYMHGSGYMFVHGAIGLLYLLAPAYAFLEKSETLPHPTMTVSAVYYLLQYFYYIVVVGLWRWRTRPMGE